MKKLQKAAAEAATNRICQARSGIMEACKKEGNMATVYWSLKQFPKLPVVFKHNGKYSARPDEMNQIMIDTWEP
eukprot:8917054-Karenia_brevis.AAC.1